MRTITRLTTVAERISQVAVEFIDVRILVFGVMTKPQSHTSINTNAHLLLNPPGIEPRDMLLGLSDTMLVNNGNVIEDHGVYPAAMDSPSSPSESHRSHLDSNPANITSLLSVSQHSFCYPYSYTRMTRPLPAPSHTKYPFYTPGGNDTRWRDLDEIRDQGGRWVGSVM